MASSIDIHYMRHALNMARTGLGRMDARPSVGCVLTRCHRVIAAARTGDGGSPHAEAAAIAQAGPEAHGCTAYVTLEPCSHEGKNPPCADALIQAGIERVVVACLDPNPKVNGQGIEKLTQTGMVVETGVMEEEARELNKGFFLTITENRPLVTLKMATSADEKFLKGEGKPLWVTNEQSRLRGHLERARHDAILLGIGAVIDDDPLLTTRIPGLEHNIIRVILDGKLEIPLESQLVHTASEHPVWIFYTDDPEDKASKLEKIGCRLFHQEGKSLKPMLSTLAQEGITRLMVEGGLTVWGIFLSEDCCDRFLHFQSPRELRDDGFDVSDVIKAKNNLAIHLKKTAHFGEDLLELYEKPA